VNMRNKRWGGGERDGKGRSLKDFIFVNSVKQRALWVCCHWDKRGWTEMKV
jgi:hypothetical protein